MKKKKNTAGGMLFKYYSNQDYKPWDYVGLDIQEKKSDYASSNVLKMILIVILAGPLVFLYAWAVLSFFIFLFSYF